MQVFWRGSVIYSAMKAWTARMHTSGMLRRCLGTSYKNMTDPSHKWLQLVDFLSISCPDIEYETRAHTLNWHERIHRTINRETFKYTRMANPSFPRMTNFIGMGHHPAPMPPWGNCNIKLPQTVPCVTNACAHTHTHMFYKHIYTYMYLYLYQQSIYTYIDTHNMHIDMHIYVYRYAHICCVYMFVPAFVTWTQQPQLELFLAAVSSPGQRPT